MKQIFFFWIGVSGILLMLGGCQNPSVAQVSHPDPAATVVIGQTGTVRLTYDPETRDFQLVSGHPYEDFIRDLAVLPPRKIEVKARLPGIDLSRLRADLRAVVTKSRGRVVFKETDARLPTPVDVQLDLSFFRYRLVPCGGALARRKLDQPGLMTPGFGCAVSRNLLLSLVDPSERAPGRTTASVPAPPAIVTRGK